MSKLDELFRDGLGERRPEIPADLWQKISARTPAAPAGEEVDRLFAAGLTGRQAPVPAGMWNRIARALHPAPWYRRTAVLLGGLLLLLLGTLWMWPGSASKESFAAGEEVRAAATSRPDKAVASKDAKDGIPASSPAAVEAPVVPVQRRMTTGPLAGKLTTESDGKVATDDDLLPVAVSRSVALIAELPATALSPLTTELGLPTLADLPPARPQTIRRRRHRPQLEMLAGAAYAHQQFGLRDPAAGEARELREVSEFPQLSYQFSLRARYRLGERWRLLGGLTYVDIRNQLEYELRQGGRTDLLRANNHLRLLEVPLLASYEISGRRLNLSLNAGPVVNLLLAPAGGYLEPAAAMPLPLAESVDYRGNLGLGWTASLTTTYALGRGGATRLLLEPFFKHYPRSVTRPSASLSEHYWLAGLQLGLRRSF